MPSLNWIGKSAVVKHHKDVPYRLLEPVPELSCGDPDSGNLIVQGDNLHALKALLPRYAGQVKCIYIDPPYNTGNEGWVYNDNLNSPEIRRWLGEVVGKEGETLDRHDRWLCMMYPRLVLLKQFLRDDGAIFVSIDDNEVATLRLLMDEIFGSQNFVATILWQKKYAASNDHKTISPMHDFVLVYQRSPSWRRHLLPRGDEKDSQYKHEDGAGIFRPDNYTCAKTADERPNLYYAVINPNTGEEIWPKRTRVWSYSQEEHRRHVTEGLIYWGKDGRGKVPAFKRYKHALRNDGIVPQTLWPHEFAGHTDGSRKELRELLHDIHSLSDFATPKPSLLIRRILQIATDKDSLVLDSFAGSGTTAHAVLKQNTEDGGNRRFILVEMDEGIAHGVTAERVRRVSQGYKNAKGEQVEGLGCGFQFCKLSAEPLFTADGQIREDVTFAQLAEFVWFSETGTGYKAPEKKSPLLGMYQGRAIYLLYNGILDDLAIDGGNVLTGVVLDKLPKHAGPRVIYAAACRLGAPRLQREGIVFKQTPYALDVSP